MKIGKTESFLLLALIIGYGAATMATATGFKVEQDEIGEGGRQDEMFLLLNSEPVMKSDAGEMRVVRSHDHEGRMIVEKPMHIGFIQMDPNTLLLPMYLDSSLILFLRTGEATVGLIYKDHMVESQLKVGDVYPIPAGSTFYILNTGEDQRLHIICSIDPSQSLNFGAFQSFFIGGGTYPSSVLAGFGPETLSAAFNVSESKVSRIFSKQQEGPIVYLTNSRGPNTWKKFSLLEKQERLKQVKRIVQGQAEEEKEWSWWNLVTDVFGTQDSNENHKAPISYNIYNKTPDFRNDYGWRVELDESEYRPLKHTGIGVFHVNLTPGSMLAPHMNPSATEYSIVLKGSGRIQIVYPNGTLAMDVMVKEGDVFWVPRYFACCQTASKSEAFEFLGFTSSSSQKNRPQFLVGKNSLLHTLNSLELANAFGVSRKKIRRLINAQRESMILPSSSSPSADDDEKKKAVSF
ncbi:putative Mitochondrial [Hibiscus syriacus]|uniref:Mitochondrial n=1 Tax=Hibiscus syriacus TaxID=106335 RepID=A0A6A3CQ72_HIBSY|nr:vicilin-like seed storage protein At2g28490 [Hibiscus syriacus]KAE8731590.1 putative Mitochondrial [Hibiscus syriacus]